MDALVSDRTAAQVRRLMTGDNSPDDSLLPALPSNPLTNNAGTLALILLALIVIPNILTEVRR